MLEIYTVLSNYGVIVKLRTDGIVFIVLIEVVCIKAIAIGVKI
jgi:hypothetical protein